VGGGGKDDNNNGDESKLHTRTYFVNKLYINWRGDTDGRLIEVMRREERKQQSALFCR